MYMIGYVTTAEHGTMIIVSNINHLNIWNLRYMNNYGLAGSLVVSG